MRGKEDLFQLIKSLSKSEKRYFTLDAQKSGRNSSRYLELFQAINQQDDYDEESLKQRFGKGLPDDKSRLYEAIMRSMRDYRSAKSYAARIKELLLDAKFLYERDLYEQAEDRLAQAKEIAYELGDNLSILECIKEQRKIFKDRWSKGYENQLNDQITAKNHALHDLVEEFRILDQHDALLVEVIRNPESLDEREKKRLTSTYQALLAGAHSPPQSVWGRLRFYQGLALLHQLLGERDKVYDYFIETILWWNKNPKLKEEEFDLYIKNFSSLLHAAFSNPKRYDQIPGLLQSLEDEAPTNLHDKKLLFQKLTTYRLVYLINEANFTNIDLTLKTIEEGLKQYDISPGNELAILFNAAVLAFLADNFPACDKWLEKIFVSGKKTSLRQDIQDGARILSCIVNYQKDDIDLNENTIRSVGRYFQKKQDSTLALLAKVIINHLRQGISSPTEEEKGILQNLSREIDLLKTNSGRFPLGLDELIGYWIQSKVKNQPIARMMKKG